jgi:nitrate/nitrite transport system ATP-binding protein
MSENPLLELSKVGKGYGPSEDRFEVLEDVSLSIREGEFVAIVGYSGAGKTTLLSLMAGLTPPDRGTVAQNGTSIAGPGPERAVVFQNYSLLPWLSVAANVALAVDQVFPRWSRARRRDHVEKYLSLVRLTEARHKRPHELSGGMRQRVALARALAMNPAILLMDEPLGALDALTRATLQDELVRIWEEDRKTVVLVTNDVDEAILLADRIVPLTIGPHATLGPSMPVEIPRPRDRKTLNHDPRCREIRNRVMGYLLGAGRRWRDLAPLAVEGAP